MKVTFSKEDFNGCGQMLIRNSSLRKTSDLDFAISVAYKVGYCHAPQCFNGKMVALISLEDGMIVPFDSDESLCEHLNNDPYGYRPMTDDEVGRIVGHHGARW